MDMSFGSAVAILLLVVDPIGNIPIFVSLLRQCDPARRTRVIARECAIAFAVLLAFVFVGDALLKLFGLSGTSLTIAGGVILFLIALRMIFWSGAEVFANLSEGEPFVVLLAILSIVGSIAIVTVVLFASAALQRWPEGCAAVTIAAAVACEMVRLRDRI